jgi:adenylate kinase
MTIFIAGIHGVGKTYLAKQAASEMGLKYATASQLIREERGHASWDSNKRVDEVENNQNGYSGRP